MAKLAKFILPGVDEVSPIRALHSLRDEHLGHLSTALSRIPGEWSLDRHEGCDGDLTAIVSARGENSASFVVSRTRLGFQLALNNDDEYENLGSFKSLDELVSVIAASTAPSVQPTSNSPSAAVPFK